MYSMAGGPARPSAASTRGNISFLLRSSAFRLSTDVDVAAAAGWASAAAAAAEALFDAAAAVALALTNAAAPAGRRGAACATSRRPAFSI